MQPTNETLEEFVLIGTPILLPGGENRTYRVDDYILKHIHKDSEEYTN